ncbi:MAG TPA: hypothetical protein PKE05_06830 [Microthrixaceae bacterium]|nr:hypothetical protein [Microthrixaceae bacterium]
MFDSITNRAEFFSDHYLNARLKADLGPLRAAWDTAEGRDLPTARVGLRSAPRPFFAARAAAFEAAQSATSPSGRARRDDAVCALHDVVLHALGFGAATSGSKVDAGRAMLELSRAGGTDTLVVSAAAHVRTPTGLLLVALDCGLATDVDELFDDGSADTGAAGVGAAGDLFEAGLLISPLHRDGGQHVVAVAADAPGELFSTDDPPRFVLLVAGTVVLLAERSKWAEGRFLAVDLDAAFERADTTRGGELDTIAALFSADALVPGHLDADGDAASVIDGFIDASQRHAVGVSKELRDGMRRSVEILGDEVRRQRYAETQRRHDVRYAGERVDARELRLQCLRYLYRLIVLLYAESRPELGVLPVGDDAYRAGYSLDRLRDLVLVELTDDHARNGHHFQDSLDLLFGLVNRGNHAEHAQLSLLAAAQDDGSGSDPVRSHEDYLEFPGLDATIFDPAATPLLDGVTLRNEALQQVLSLLMVSPGRKRDDQAGFISYAELGINQLGAVYEGLMAYTGFFATEDLFEVAKGGDPSDGTWMVPVADADAYPDDVFVTRTDADTGVTERVRHPEGSFVYRLAGRDRQRSASYYTPEVLTQCVVRHALAELLGTDDHARVPGGSAGITQATEILELTVCEPALGSGAFLNEAINQLAAEYLRRRQAERGEVLDAERYQRELQKVKAHFALHQCYGVDLNATAVELAEVSLWLNSMHPGLKAPWFGLQLRQGNSLIGARRATWSIEQLFGKDPGGAVWARARSTDTRPVAPPTDRPLAEPLPDGHVHHFLLPGHGWGAVSGRKEAKELAPDAAKALAEWRKAVLKAPNQTHADRLVALANGVERLWAEATDVLDALHRRMRRPLGLYGTDGDAGAPDDDRRKAEAILAKPDSALGRLRLVMDAWVGLWFWPLDDPAGDDSTDGGSHGRSERVAPPSWAEWLTTLEAIVGPEPTTPTGQLDLFADLAELERIESARSAERGSVGDVLEQHPWLARAQALARVEGAWHWELEFAPVFRAGGFDLQVGNPPWVRPTWKDDLVLAESDPWWGITDKAAESVRKSRRADLLERVEVRSTYLGEVASAEGVVSTLGSAQLRPVLSGVQTNLYMVFMDTVWRHGSERGMTGLLHPISHFVDPAAGQLRAESYRNLRRLWQFANELILFEDVDHHTEFAVAISSGRGAVIDVLEDVHHEFLQLSNALQPATVDGSLEHDGSGPVPAVQYPAGGWDVRPHRDRLITVDLDVLSDWARLFDEPGTPPEQARLLRPVTRQDLDALSVLADAPTRLADHDYFWTAGWHEKGAKTDGTIEWRTDVPASWDEVILQGPHFTVATPFAKQPNENCKHNLDYSDWGLEALPERVIPRTNYQRACDRDTYDANLAHWNGHLSCGYWRAAHRLMTQPGLERSLHMALLPPGPSHIHGIQTTRLSDDRSVARWVAFCGTLPLDYLTKVSGTANISDTYMQRFPFPKFHPLDQALLLRTLRLNCLTADYVPLWEELFDPSWADDAWTAEPDSPWGRILARVPLGDVDPTWSMATPLRRDAERRMALVELDAIAAIMLGLSAEQLCAMYRTQFAVLRKYEYAMAFDAEGRKVCAHHQSAGFRQSQLQAQAKDGERDKRWQSVWKLVEAEEDEPGSVDWEGEFTPPFTRPDREAEMTAAYHHFSSAGPQ